MYSNLNESIIHSLNLECQQHIYDASGREKA